MIYNNGDIVHYKDGIADLLAEVVGVVRNNSELYIIKLIDKDSIDLVKLQPIPSGILDSRGMIWDCHIVSESYIKAVDPVDELLIKLEDDACD